MSFLDDAISTLGRGLAQTATQALSNATGYDVGGTLNALFGNGQSNGGDDITTLLQDLQQGNDLTDQEISMLTQSVQQQISVTTDLGNELSALAQSVSQIVGQVENIEALLNAINQQQLYQAWETLDSSMTPYLSSIKTSFNAYSGFVSNFTGSSSDQIPGLIGNILSTDDGPFVGLAALNQTIIDDGQSKGVLQLWSNMVSAVVAAGRLDYRDAVQQYFGYYQKLAYAQLQATNLVMEAYNYNPDDQSSDDSPAQRVWKQYRTQLLAQEEAFITWMIPLVTAAIPGGALPPPNGGFTFSAQDAAEQLNPGVQRTPPSSSDSTTSYYAPSPLFRQAEELLASLYVTGPMDRRIVVYMMYSADIGISSLLDGVNLTLSPPGGGTPVAATGSVRLGAPFLFSGDTLPDYNFDAGGFYCKRFVFSAAEAGDALVDGNYSITDINGTNGLVPLETYLSEAGQNPNPPFMNANVLAYQVSVYASQAFDFMNFVAYMTPVTSAGAFD